MTKTVVLIVHHHETLIEMEFLITWIPVLKFQRFTINSKTTTAAQMKFLMMVQDTHSQTLILMEFKTDGIHVSMNQKTLMDIWIGMVVLKLLEFILMV